MSIDAGTHWCYSCGEPVHLQRQNTVCPDCNGYFIHELGDTTSINTEENNQRPTFINVISNFLTQQLSVRGNNTSDGNSLNGGLLEFLNETLGFGQENGDDYFIAPRVEEFPERPNPNAPNVPPPASRFSIDALLTIKISKKHVRLELTCAVCTEKFELGSRVSKLPCKHLYHSTCPVCRLELSSPQMTNDSRRSRRRGRWSSLWWFCSPRSDFHHNVTVEPSSVSYCQDDHRNREYSYWPFEY
ncbi:E3 ubiquitin-protein ligase ring1-like [Phtheirospermum japonicum]|uniref:RING-type E3 ubiquitin transferase n=1 Tax=Phtheirospermum japonicum TaxID=374723 RepID=A0A830D348_9LAMI|nr:E3 ubiquitin-protein ligase ring1-like [Phtheirospermum japonicum]